MPHRPFEFSQRAPIDLVKGFCRDIERYTKAVALCVPISSGATRILLVADTNEELDAAEAYLRERAQGHYFVRRRDY